MPPVGADPETRIFFADGSEDFSLEETANISTRVRCRLEAVGVSVVAFWLLLGVVEADATASSFLDPVCTSSRYTAPAVSMV